MDKNIKTDITEFYEMLLSDLTLPDHYKKLIKRIKNLSTIVEGFNIQTVGDITELDPNRFSKLPGIGKLYVDLLINLQNLLSQPKTDQLDYENTPIKIELPSNNKHSKLYVNYGFLTETEIKQLKKLERYYKGKIDVRNVNELLNINTTSLAKQAGFGALFLASLNDLQKKIENELVSLPEKITDHIIKHRCFFVSSEIVFIESTDIDNILIEDIESYLLTLDELKMDVALSRWGFNHKHETLEAVGSRYGLVRERIRQLEKSINADLTLNFRIQPKVIWANIREKMTDDLSVYLPNLAKCFATDKLFYEFLEICCQVKSGSIREIMMPKISFNILNPIFCSNPSPVEKEIIVNDLMSNYGYSRLAAFQGIKQLGKSNQIKISEKGISPIKLARDVAVAHALTFHPKGLPWKDIARIVNQKGYTSTPIDETRVTHGFNNNEYIYLCDNGTYRNLIFLNLEQLDISKIMQNLHDFLKQHQRDALHLKYYYDESKGNRSEIEYFTLRHLVREYGEDYGLYFNGRSGADSVSLDANVLRITQADVIIQVLKESKTALTKQEIAQRLRSRSINHAGFYIYNLMEEGKVVRVDKMVYTTPEKAFKDLDIKAIMRIIKDIMDSSDIIVEADVFREYVNIELNLGYSKYIYAALVKSQIKELSWYRKGSLFCKTDIPYNSLFDMCNKLCNPKLSNSENMEMIREMVWLTDPVAKAVIHRWKTEMNSARNI